MTITFKRLAYVLFSLSFLMLIYKLGINPENAGYYWFGVYIVTCAVNATLIFPRDSQTNEDHYK